MKAIIVIMIIISSLFAEKYNIVFNDVDNLLSSHIESFKNKKIGIISNVGNIFTSYHDNPMHHNRYYHMIESWENDIFIQNSLKNLLEEQGFKDIKIIKNVPTSIVLNDKSWITDKKEILKKSIESDLVNILIKEKYKAIIYIDKLIEREDNRFIKVNNKILNNTNIGISKFSFLMSDTQELLTATFNIKVLYSEYVKVKDIVNPEKVKDSYLINRFNMYFHSTKPMSKIIWNDTSKEININSINALENPIKDLLLENINKFLMEHYKINEELGK